MQPRIMYIELKDDPDGHNERGPAHIGRVTFSKSGRSMYYRGKRFQKLHGGGYANCYDVETGDEYWISGPKKNGQDRHWAGGGPVEIDEDVREEYWTTIRKQPENAKQKLS